MIAATAHSIALAPLAVAARRASLTCYLMVLDPAGDYLHDEPAARRMMVLPRMFGPKGH
ncbi:hypothetical protein [Bradyrhizobium japonicum]|uniref:hypothetical protein n=1 Tax=Bradyrhizobium japonicum TaxID=375 RepID=UPI001BAC25CE|nr:hypothetical protein [Bradyrhizobium japonicum]MBR0961997.1 hypothetical protein [Bradyrhizobium japonicum]